MSSDLRRALEDRLKASSSEYREFDLKLTQARATLLVCAAAQLGFGLLLFWFGSRGVAAEVAGDGGVPLSLLVDCVSAIGFLVAFVVSARNPMRGLGVGAAVWVMSRFSGWMGAASVSTGGIFVGVATALILLRGFLAARHAEELRQRLIAEATSAQITARQSAR